MKKLTTTVVFPKAVHPISYAFPVLFMGSCFAQHIYEKLKRSGFSVYADPFGISFNPMSIADNLELLLSDRTIKEEELFLHQGLYHHFSFHSICSHPDRQKALELINSGLEQARRTLPALSHIYVTFGTAWLFKREGETVNNCHKLPAAEFKRELAEVEQIVERWNSLKEKFKRTKPEVRFHFSLSPVRHWKDGAEGNSLSKAILRVAIGKIISSEPAMSYLPAYEFMMDECRDYRFYADDLLHPSDLAIDLIWERFRESQLEASEQAWVDEHLALAARKAHRSRFPGTLEDERFKAETFQIESALKAKLLEKRWPGFNIMEG